MIPKDVLYTGVDIAKGMIDEARKYDRNPKHTYLIADVTQAVSAPKTFTHATFILSLQNIKDQKGAIKLTSEHLATNGTLIIVLNHPAFRIPRQSSWEIDENNKLEYKTCCDIASFNSCDERFWRVSSGLASWRGDNSRVLQKEA